MIKVFLVIFFLTTSLFSQDGNQTEIKTDFIKQMLEVEKESNSTILKSLELSEMIEKINDYPIIKSVNSYLEYIYTDIGRLTLFVIIIILSYFLRNIGQMIFPALKKIFKTTEDNPHDTEVEDFEVLKDPLAFLIKVFGINLAIDVLFYPSDAPKFIDIALYIAYLVGFVKLFSVFIDIFFDIYFTNTYKKKNIEFRKELVNLIKQILKAIVYIVSFLLFLKKMNVDITGFVASLGLGGLMIAMASKDTVSNFFGSLKIIFDESFSQGDWISVAGVEGTVIELGFISTKIRTFDNALISLPNAKLANESVKNYNRRKVGRRIKMHIGVSYSAKREDLVMAVDEIRQMLVKHPKIATEDKIGHLNRRSTLIESSDLLGVKSTLLVHVDSFGDSSINILIYAFSKTTNWAEWLEVKQDILLKIWKILDDRNLEMPFPTQTIYLEQKHGGEDDDIVAINGKS